MTVINPFYIVVAGPDAGDTVAAFQWTDTPTALDEVHAFMAEFVADPEDFTVTVDGDTTSTGTIGHQVHRDTGLYLQVYGRQFKLDYDDWIVIGELDEHRDTRPIRMVTDADFRRAHKQALQ